MYTEDSRALEVELSCYLFRQNSVPAELKCVFPLQNILLLVCVPALIRMSLYTLLKHLSRRFGLGTAGHTVVQLVLARNEV